MWLTISPVTFAALPLSGRQLDHGGGGGGAGLIASTTNPVIAATRITASPM
jgi:hypothetical protein